MDLLDTAKAVYLIVNSSVKVIKLIVSLLEKQKKAPKALPCITEQFTKKH